MINYLAYWAWWWGWRAATTLACILTIQNVIHQQSGIWIRTQPLILASICVIIAIRIWSSKPDPNSIKNGK